MDESDNGDDEEGDMDYKLDGFVVGDDSGSDNDDNDTQRRRKKKKRKEKSLKRLKRRDEVSLNYS